MMSVEQETGRIAATWPRRKWASYAVFALCSALGAILGLYVVMEFDIGSVNPMYPAALAIVIVALVLLGVRLLVENKEDVPFCFLVVATPALCCFCFFMLPGSVPDEPWHIYRVLNFEGNGNGGMVVPDALTFGAFPSTYASLHEALMLAPDPASVHIVNRDMSSYLSYLYAVPGVFAFVAESVGANPFVVVYSARLSNVALFLVGGYWILKLIPFAKPLTFVYLLNPMLLQQEASCSADVLVNILALLFIAFVLKLRFEGVSNARTWAVLGVLSLAMVLSKYAYAPLLLLLLLLVPRVASKKARRVVYASVSGVLALGVVFMLFVYQGSAFRDAINLVRNPLECFEVLLRTYYQTGPFIVGSFAGISLGALNIAVWEPCLWLFGGLLLAACFNSLSERFSFKVREKVFIVCLFCGMMLLLTLIFRGWSIQADHSYDVISGIQGRYFIPIALLPVLCLFDSKAVLLRRNCIPVFTGALLVIYMFDFLSVVRFFW